MLPQSFFAGDTVEAARALVGKYLARQYGGVLLADRKSTRLNSSH